MAGQTLHIGVSGAKHTEKKLLSCNKVREAGIFLLLFLSLLCWPAQVSATQIEYRFTGGNGNADFATYKGHATSGFMDPLITAGSLKLELNDAGLPVWFAVDIWLKNDADDAQSWFEGTTYHEAFGNSTSHLIYSAEVSPHNFGNYDPLQQVRIYSYQLTKPLNNSWEFDNGFSTTVFMSVMDGGGAASAFLLDGDTFSLSLNGGKDASFDLFIMAKVQKHAVPEPSTMALLFAGAPLIARWKKLIKRSPA